MGNEIDLEYAAMIEDDIVKKTGEYELAEAVLRHGIEDLKIDKDFCDSSFEWVVSDSDGPFSFNWCCEIIGIDSTTVRRKALNLEKPTCRVCGGQRWAPHSCADCLNARTNKRNSDPAVKERLRATKRRTAQRRREREAAEHQAILERRERDKLRYNECKSNESQWKAWQERQRKYQEKYKKNPKYKVKRAKYQQQYYRRRKEEARNQGNIKPNSEVSELRSDGNVTREVIGGVGVD